MIWATAVTTVPSRRDDLLPRTLASLRAAGFPSPRLFIDGAHHGTLPEYASTECEISARWPTLRAWGNWLLALVEMLARNPYADWFLISQDDVVYCRNVRQYLESCVLPEKGYFNLFTFLQNEQVIAGKPKGTWHESALVYPELRGQAKYEKKASLQVGKGALALAFPHDAVIELLSQRHLYLRFKDKRIGHRSIDGAVVTAMNDVGYREYVHAPSLVRHIGNVSTVRPEAEGHIHGFPLDETFPGEAHNAMEFLSNAG